MLNRTLSPALMPNNEAINYRARVSERVFSSMRILQMCIKCPNLFLGVIVCGFFFWGNARQKKEREHFTLYIHCEHKTEWLDLKTAVTLRLVHLILSHLPPGVLCRPPISIFSVDMRQRHICAVTVWCHPQDLFRSKQTEFFVPMDPATVHQ